MKKVKNKNNRKQKRVISSFEIFVMVTAIFAFAYLISSPEIVSAAETPKGCCPEAKNGAVCQDMNKVDEEMCKTSLVATSCDLYDTCKKGCCYNPNEGLCSPNSPKDKCIQNGGNWTNDATCDSQSQCALACCVLGTQAPMVTSRQCTKLSNEYGFTKKFEAIDAEKGCTAYTNLDDEGACVMKEGEYAPFDCKFETKKECQSNNGEFYKDFLCTNINLNTLCVPTVGGEFRTSCIENKDQTYFIDSCGNRANIYDSSRANDPEYWKTVIPASQSCASTPNSASCGNCDILTGSNCQQYRTGKDAKPNMGDSVCRDLNCNAYGKKHGESWCIGEYDTSIFGVAPVGSRNFKAICMDGEVTIEPCADFNQEICLQQSSGSFSEAQCVINDWRTCLSINEVGNDDRTYDDVKEKCDKNPQCVMFNEIEGETIASKAYEQNGMTGFPGFRETKSDGESIANTEQAKYNDVGKDYNKVIPLCVPKYTEGLQFWTNENNRSSTNSSSSSTANYGGSTAETTAICSMGNFICVGGEKKSKLFGSFEEDENIICITDGSQKDQVPVYIDTLNERCRMLGSCGAYVNIVGELGSNAEDLNKNSTKLINRGKIGSDGSYSKEKGSTDHYSDGYLESLSGKPGGYLALQEFAGTNKGGTVPSIDALKFKDVISTLQGEAKVDIGAFAKFAPSTLVGVGAGLGNLFEIGVGKQTWFGFDSIPKQTAAAQLSAAGAKGAELAAQEGLKEATKQLAEAEKVLTAAENSFKSATTPAELAKASNDIEIAQRSVIKSTEDVGKATTKVGEATQKVKDTAGQADKLSASTQLMTAAVIIVVTIVIGILLDKWDPIGGGMSPGDKAAVYSMATSVLGAGLTVAAWALGLIAMGPVGWALLIVGVIAAAVMQFFTYKTENQYYVMSYTCAPWEPPLDGNCDACNKNSLLPCSDYRCRSLGADCQYFNSLGEPGTCAKITDTTSATITPWPEILTAPYQYSDVQEMRASVNDVEAYTGIQLGVITDKSAKCKIDTKHTSTYDEMSYDMISSASANGLVGYNHMIALSPFVTSASSTAGDGTQGTAATSENSAATLPMTTGENRYFIRCKNFAGHENSAEFIFKVTVKEGPDATAPIITKFVPETNSYVGYGFNTTTVQFYVNEPAECKYSQGYNLAYNDMIGTTTCVNMAVLGEWPCYAILNLSAGENNNYYFKCKDTAGNKNENAKEYSLNSCQNGLNITEKSPSGEIKIGTETGEVELYLKTSGCIEGGKATCKFNLGGESNFANTDSTEHLQVFTTLPAGEYNIPVKCTDIAGNTAAEVVRFNLTIIDTAPIVIFASKSGGILKIITNEPAECRYAKNNTDSCAFNFEEGTKMTDISTIHTTQYENEKTYYIKCKNAFDITNSDCGIIVMPGK